MNGALPPTSLVICSRNRQQFLRETVASVLAGQEVPSEIVLVDQSDTPDPLLAAYASQPGCQVRYYPVRSTGLSRARNTGIELARYELIAILDDDMFVAPDWFGSLMRALLAACPEGVVTGRVLPSTEGSPGGFVPSLAVDETPGVYRGRLSRDVLAGGHMAACRSVFQQVGLFDERLGAGTNFPSSEDNDWGFRLLESGRAVHYVPQAVIYHRAWRSRRDYFPMRWGYGRGMGAFYAKHLSLRDRHMLRRLIRDIGRRVLRSRYRLFHNERQLGLGDLVFVLGILTGLIQWLITQPRERMKQPWKKIALVP